jgi:hypothetical protein
MSEGRRRGSPSGERGGMTTHKEKPSGTVRAGATLALTKIHGPNSPQVLSGAVAEGFEETIPGYRKVIEVDYDKAVSLWGEETADELFAKRDSEEG